MSLCSFVLKGAYRLEYFFWIESGEMGGKQKRAAKYRKWLEARTLLKENQLKESKLRSQLDQDKLCYSYEGGGDADQDYQRMHPRMRQEVTRGRRKFKKARFSENSWFTRKLT